MKSMAMRTLILILVSVLTVFIACTNTTENKVATNTTYNPELPPGTISAIVTISDLNCWVEQGQFFVIGVCDSGSD